MKYHLLLLILIPLFFCACASDEDIVQEGETILSVRDTIDFLALGDSYTRGQGVSLTESWPLQLSRKLEGNGYFVKQTQLIAQTGWTTQNLLNAIEKTDLEGLGNKRLVSLLIGVNNQYQGLSFDLFKTEFNVLLDKSIQLAGTHEKVFVVSIPDYGVTTFGNTLGDEISSEIDEYNQYIRDQCENREILFIDVTTISRELGSSDNALSDGLHPSRFQYERWVQKMLPFVLAMLYD